MYNDVVKMPAADFKDVDSQLGTISTALIMPYVFDCRS